MSTGVWRSIAAMIATLFISSSGFGQGATGGVVAKQNKDASGLSDDPAPRRTVPKRASKQPTVASPAATATQGDFSTCSKVLEEFYWVTTTVTIKAGGSAESPKGNGRWSCKNGTLNVYWENGVPVETFTVTEIGDLTGHWFISPKRLR